MKTDKSAVELVRELVRKAREDTPLWETLKKNERQLQAAAERGEDVDDPAAVLGLPNLAMLSLRISDFIRRHDYDDLNQDDEVYNCLVIMLRSFVRKELGLPVDLDWDLDDVRKLH